MSLTASFSNNTMTLSMNEPLAHRAKEHVALAAAL